MADEVKYECTKCGKVIYIEAKKAETTGHTTGSYYDGNCRDGNSHIFAPRRGW